jgi:hypothetical protein
MPGGCRPPRRHAIGVTRRGESVRAPRLVATDRRQRWRAGRARSTACTTDRCTTAADSRMGLSGPWRTREGRSRTPERARGRPAQGSKRCASWLAGRSKRNTS